MPEGPTLHRAARDLQPLVGLRVRASSPQGRFAAGARAVDGRVLREVEAYGKHLFLGWDATRVVHVHLGLAGKFLRLGPSPAPPRPQVRLRLLTSRGGIDLIAPVLCERTTRAGRDAVVARLGPDPLRADADVARFRDAVAKSTRSIGALLMDQAVIAGVGNVIRAEILFVTGVHPLRPGASLTRARVDALWDAAGAMMRRAMKAGRLLSLPIADDVPESAGRWVYRQDACRRCGGAVERLPLAGRTAYACRRCQPLERGRTAATPRARRAGGDSPRARSGSADTATGTPARRATARRRPA